LRKGGASSGNGRRRQQVQFIPLSLEEWKSFSGKRKKREGVSPRYRKDHVPFVLKEEVSDDISFFIF